MHELIYCADGNKRFAEIAIENGFTYGAQLPNTVYFPPEFVDQDWKNPNLKRYEMALSEKRPRLASVLDWECQEQLRDVLNWAIIAAEYVSEAVIIIPKVVGGIEHLPTEINQYQIPIRLGFSWPTKFGQADWMILYEMIDWPNGIHILGGPPHGAHALAHGVLQLPYQNPHPDLWLQSLNVKSVDGNMHLKMATRFNAFFDPLKQTGRGYWPTLGDFDGKKWGDGSSTADAPYEAFSRSCRNIRAMWDNDPSRFIRVKEEDHD